MFNGIFFSPQTFPFISCPFSIRLFIFFSLFWRHALSILATKPLLATFIVNIFCQSVVWILTLFMVLFFFPQILFILAWSTYRSLPLWVVNFVLFMTLNFTLCPSRDFRIESPKSFKVFCCSPLESEMCVFILFGVIL